MLPASPELVDAITTGFSNPTPTLSTTGPSPTPGPFQRQTVGIGQFYLMTIKDKNGDPFDGAATYRLRVAANVPVTLYWSLPAYDRATHPDPGRAVGQPILEHPWPAGEFRRLSGFVLRTEAARRATNPLGPPRRTAGSRPCAGSTGSLCQRAGLV